LNVDDFVHVLWHVDAVNLYKNIATYIEGFDTDRDGNIRYDISISTRPAMYRTITKHCANFRL